MEATVGCVGAEQVSNEDNARDLTRLLEAIDSSSLTQRDKGTRFETLCRDWLMNEPAYGGLFAKVETYREWAEGHAGLAASSKDTGIDLVATNKDEEGTFTAIQCKFYARDAKVPKAGIDSFLSASSKDWFTRRFLIATNGEWTDNALATLRGQSVPVTLVTRSTLASSAIRWAEYLRTGRVARRARKTPRPYQEEAIRNVVNGFRDHDRGKLVMACGTGKTFTAMKIAETMEGDGGFVMFLVPSLSLLSQTLTDWKQQCAFAVNAFAVCSDPSTGKADSEDLDSLTSRDELEYPATTNPARLAENVARARSGGGMTVIFSTYQSLDVVAQAQARHGMGEIGLVVCDEAHRTAGGRYFDEKDAVFQRIHDGAFVKARKRLYMTATPRIFGSELKGKEKNKEVVLYSMDDEDVFGPVFHSISFAKAVSLGSLVDYKVIVLGCGEDLLDREGIDDFDMVDGGGLTAGQAAKVVGCWRALSKLDFDGNSPAGDGATPMRRAVGFAQRVNAPTDTRDIELVSSKLLAGNFQRIVDEFKDTNFKRLKETTPGLTREAYERRHRLKCECRHIDGTMDATEKSSLLEWLRQDPPRDGCKILFNVRCLSEGIDVPSLDAVLFLAPRRSQIDVVQIVGRVMRISPKTGKKRGYVIIPVVTPPGWDPSYALDNNKSFDTVWQILRALKSIDEDFGAMAVKPNGELDGDKIEVIAVTDRLGRGRGAGSGKIRRRAKVRDDDEQLIIDFGHDEFMENEIRSRIVRRIKAKREWGDWAEDVGEICQRQIEYIKRVLADSGNEPSRRAFDGFRAEMKATVNGALDDEAIIEMLGQHVVTKPILDALFTVRDGDGNLVYEFTKCNPIARAMTAMVESLDKKGMRTAYRALDDFYKSVRRRTQSFKTAADRQVLIKELFEKFFKKAFPKQQEKLGIVYTPIEIVDFINQSVADILRREFNADIADEGIHVLDPFCGTGTFLARLMQTGLIPAEKLRAKFERDLHGNEIVPLAYYVASMNLEGVFHEICRDAGYSANNAMVLTDTFADNQKSDFFKSALSENNARLAALNDTDIRVIVANPPYSVGQESGNDDNQNEHYEKLDARIADTYAARTNSTNKNSLYDSYIRAFRWASDRIGDKGVIGFVTNAGWIESNSADGMRKCLAEEFSSIYIYHLKGDQRTSGERSRREGGKVFGAGSRSPIAVTILVKNPGDRERGKIYIKFVDDYLKAEEKLAQLRETRSVVGFIKDDFRRFPDRHGDWLNQRDDSFASFIRVDGKKTTEIHVFKNHSRGVATSRDPWAYNSSKTGLQKNIATCINEYNRQLKNDGTISIKPGLIKWARSLQDNFRRGRKSPACKAENVYASAYRPFVKQFLYFDPFWNEMMYQMPALFPTRDSTNLTICINQAPKESGYIALMTDCIADLHLNGDSQCFPRYIYQEDKSQTVEDMFEPHHNSGFKRLPAITPEGLCHFQEAYPNGNITPDDIFFYIYGILHSPDYRGRYADNLAKELPRIPRVAAWEDFRAFVEAGRRLADLHVNYETVEPYKGCRIVADGDATYEVERMRWRKIKGRKGNDANDKTCLILNGRLRVEDIPLEAQEYVVNKRSALDWLVEKCRVSVDKESGIVNDFNDYARETGNPRYVLDLVLRVITVSLETTRIAKGLPQLVVHPLDR